MLGCNRESAPDCFKTAGEVTDQRIETGAYDALLLLDNLDIVLVNDSVDYGVITAPKNLIPKIRVENVGGMLKVENKNTCNFVRKLNLKFTLTLHFTQLDSIVNEGVGNIGCTETLSFQKLHIENQGSSGTIDLDLDCDRLDYYIHAGVSDAILRGEATSAYVFHQGGGPFHAEQLNCDQIEVDSRSITNMYVKPISFLGAGINDDGNIYCYGSPADYDLNDVGNGELIFVE